MPLSGKPLDFWLGLKEKGSESKREAKKDLLILLVQVMKGIEQEQFHLAQPLLEIKGVIDLEINLCC